MKNILKRIFIPIFGSVVFGFICGRFIYNIYLEDDNIDSNIVYLIQSGAYSSYDNMRANTIGYDYIYYEEDNLYKTVVGVVKQKENIDKIKELYNDDIIINKYYINDEELNDKLIELDNKLLNSSNNDETKDIILSMLNLYKKENNVKLVKIS